MQSGYNHILEWSKVDLHDSELRKIVIEDSNTVQFVFPNGIYDLSAHREVSAVIECSLESKFFDCLEDISCVIYRRFVLFHQLFYYVKDVSFQKLADKLSNGAYLDIIEEYYHADRIFWRGLLRDGRRSLKFELIVPNVKTRTVFVQDKNINDFEKDQSGTEGGEG